MSTNYTFTLELDMNELKQLFTPEQYDEFSA